MASYMCFRISGTLQLLKILISVFRYTGIYLKVKNKFMTFFEFLFSTLSGNKDLLSKTQIELYKAYLNTTYNIYI